MTYDYHKVFEIIERQLSAQPGIHLQDLAKKLRCSQPTIEKVIANHTRLSFRDYQAAKMLENIHRLLVDGRSVKEISLTVGYKWPNNFSRFVRKRSGCIPSELNRKQWIKTATLFRQIENFKK